MSRSRLAASLVAPRIDLIRAGGTDSPPGEGGASAEPSTITGSSGLTWAIEREGAAKIDAMAKARTVRWPRGKRLLGFISVSIGFVDATCCRSCGQARAACASELAQGQRS